VIADLPGFDQVVALDTEYTPVDGGHPIPICLSAYEFRSGTWVRLWQDELGAEPPFPTGDRTLHVMYNFTAEASFYLACGWPLPARVLDLMVEFRNHTNKALPKHLKQQRYRLLDASEYFDLRTIDAVEKHDLQMLAVRGGPYTNQERIDLQDYCDSDVRALWPLLERLLIHIRTRHAAGPGSPRRGLAQALHRGLYMNAVAHMEHNGVPIDVPTRARIMAHREEVIAHLIAQGDRQYDVYRDGIFQDGLFRNYLERNNILDGWPRTDIRGRLKTDKDTMKAQARAHPQLEDLRQLLLLRSALRDNSVVVGSDDRNRTSLFPFGTATGRNSPSTSEFIFGPSSWLRGLIKPTEGHALAYIDYSVQEIAIAGCLSGDPELLKAVESGEPYLALMHRAGLVPEWATKATHKTERGIGKVAMLGMGYGMHVPSLAAGTGLSMVQAQSLFRQLKKIYDPFYQWSQQVIDTGLLRRELRTYCGWRARVVDGVKPNTLRNFPAQAHGAEILRHACALLVAHGVRLLAPIHDAVLIEAPVEEIDAQVELARRLMARASAEILNGFEILTDAEVVRYPDRYMDDRGEHIWALVMEVLTQLT